MVLGGGGLFQDQQEFDPAAILTPAHGGMSYWAGFALLSHLRRQASGDLRRRGRTVGDRGRQEAHNDWPFGRPRPLRSATRSRPGFSTNSGSTTCR